MPVFVAIALSLSLCACNGGFPMSPTPNEPPPPAPPSGSGNAGLTLRGVSLSGVVWELTAAGRTPIAGATIYCEPCGEETHTFATADENGFYHFPGDLASGGGIWVAPGWPTPLAVGLYNKDFADPPGLPASRYGPGWREVLIDGDTRFDIELVRRSVRSHEQLHRIVSRP